MCDREAPSAIRPDMIRWEQRDDGIVVLTLDDPQQLANTMNASYRAAMDSTVDRLVAQKATIVGVIITSAKDSFLAGADLKELTDAAGLAEATISTAPTGSAEPSVGVASPDALGAAVFAAISQVKSHFRRLERLGRPVVAALNGSALGGGLELALACHYRIAVARDDAQFGLPEVLLGLLPGGGGVARVTRMLGLQQGLTSVLLEGKRMRPGQAKEAGLIDELVADSAELMARAIAWINANPGAAQPWDRAGYRMPGGRPTDKSLAMMLPAFPANLRKQLKGAPYPAPLAIMCAAVEGASVDFDTAIRIESRWFASLVGTQVQQNMTQAFFFDLNHLNRGGSRPNEVEKFKSSHVGVIGAGMMGAGIAFACAKAGLRVTLVDVSLEAAQRGTDYSRRILDKAVSRGKSTSDKREAHLALITPTDVLAEVAACDVVIEAVYEDLELKRQTYAKLADILGPRTLIASNTSSLPITTLAESTSDSSNFVGLHFFSPVDKMPLVEIVRGELSSDTAIARGYDLVRALGKTPIVVNDSRGFFTSRVFATYVMEGLALLSEGVPAASVEQAAAQAGYPVGPLAVTDEVSLSLGRRVRDEARRAGVRLPAHPGDAVADRMLDEFDRPGKAAGRGFYDYPGDGSAKRLWPGLAGAFGAIVPPPVSLPDMRDRMLFVQAIEAWRCRDEGVVTGSADANIGSIFGIGYPAWTGGVLQFVRTYPGGPAGFVARARQLAGAYGDRFTPPQSLLAHANSSA